ncbi:MAG: hypothetical protein O3A33_01740, partial [Chloroflexi bacterium]|nr:hypothetical protein [Chloroflexota bacterium]
MTPVFENGEVYCCDGCVIGGPCVCTYDGPPMKLDTKSILASAGYDLEALAAELSVCANCFEEFTREPVYAKDIAYCCKGCIRGGPCACTYGEASKAPENVPAIKHELDLEEPIFAGFEVEIVPEAQVGGDAPGFLKTNSLWEQISQWDDITPDDEAEYEEQRVNDLWLLRQEITGLEESEENEGQDIERPAYVPQEPQPFDLDVDLDIDLAIDSPLQSVVQRGTYKVVASPLDEVTDVRTFTSALDSTPSVESAILTHYSGDVATFEIEARNLDRVIRELVEGDYYPIRSFNMTSEGLELTLRSKAGDLLATAGQRELESQAPDYEAPPLARWDGAAYDAGS